MCEAIIKKEKSRGITFAKEHRRVSANTFTGSIPGHGGLTATLALHKWRSSIDSI